LWLETAEGPVSVVVLTGVRDAVALRRLGEAQAGVSFVDRVGDLSEIFTAYRSKTLWLTAASYLVVALLLALRYGPAGALSVIAVPLAAALVAFGALGFLAEPISLFNVMALLLILGIGVDYGIFFREAGRVRPSTLLAVALSALTTLLAFGLLTVSATLAVHAFGLTLLIGIAAAFLLSPLAALLLPARACAPKASGALP
jgi:predicted exporter